MNQLSATFNKSLLASTATTALATLALALCALSASWAQSPGVVPQCNVAPNGYSVAKAVGAMNLAHDAIERCRAATKAASGVPCREAWGLLRDADVNLWQVMDQAVDSRRGCWICRHTYLTSEARDLQKLTNRFNQIVQADGRYWRSDAHHSIEKLNIQSRAPLCHDAGNNTPWPDGREEPYDPTAVTEDNDRCSVRYTMDTGRAPTTEDFSANKCYLMYRPQSGGFQDVLVHLNEFGTAPSSYPPGFKRSNGNTCKVILDKVREMCGLKLSSLP